MISRGCLFTAFLALFLVLSTLLLSPCEGQPASRKGQWYNRARMNGQKRENARFYTTRFGKRSTTLTTDKKSPEVAAFAMNDNKVAEKRPALETVPLGRPPSIQARAIEGMDENGFHMACIYSGMRNFYVCDRFEPWSEDKSALLQ